MEKSNWEVKRKKKWHEKFPWEKVTGIATAIIAAVSVGLLFNNARQTNEIIEAQREERELQSFVVHNTRFNAALERLGSDSSTVLMGALFELEQLATERPELQEQLVRILVPFIREGIEVPGLDARPVAERISNTLPYGLPRPNYDIFYAAELVSRLRNETELNFDAEAAIYDYVIQGDTISLIHLRADRRDLREINLSGTELWNANFQGSGLRFANFEGAGLRRADFSNTSLMEANFEGAYLFLADFRNADLTDANFQDAYLIGALNLTIEQLLEAYINEATRLDDHLANDSRIQARIAELAQQATQ